MSDDPYATRPLPVEGDDPYATRVQEGDAAAAALSGITSGPRFRVLRPHANGGLGAVFVALDQELQRQVALKEILEHLADNPNSRARFLLEAEITGGLEHPGIVPVYGLGQYADGRPYYAMRFIRGDSLKEAIEAFHKDSKSRDAGARALELRKLLQRFVAVCDAMEYAHSRGVLHRDLKPANIMLGKYGETLVVDWGLAKTSEQPQPKQTTGESRLRPRSASDTTDTTMAGAAIGTPQYMSPEQAAGRLDQIGPATDNYSLGATLYSLLTGQPAFTDHEVLTVLTKVRHGEFPSPRQVNAEVPAALDAVCRKAMALKREDRYPSARALANDIEHWLADEPVAAHRESWSAWLGRWARRHQGLMRGGMAAALAVAAVAAVAMVLILQSRDEAVRHHLESERNRLLAHEQMLAAYEQGTRLYVMNGRRQMDSGDLLGSLPWFTGALLRESEDPAKSPGPTHHSPPELLRGA